MMLVLSQSFGASYGPGPCDGAMKSALWCDTSKDFKTRAAMIVANLTADEKSGLFVNGASAIPRIDFPKYNWWSEALHGLARDGVATSFPQICGVASSLNKTLFNMIGDVTGTEARGRNNYAFETSAPGQGATYHGLTMWAPNINIFRDPRWGRGEETPGEDPTINAEYVKAFVPGIQGTDERYTKAGACLKHYAAYSEETGRNSFPAVVTSQDMEDTYLPAFESGVEDAKAVGIMCSYNAETYGEGIFGPGTQGGAIPSCANKGILNDLARGKWGFDGYITSDCGAVGNVQNQHKYTGNTQDTVTAVFAAGMDTDCGRFMGAKAMTTLLQNATIATMADTSLTRLFAVQMRLGFFDPRSSFAPAMFGEEVINTAAHQALAKEAADQSLVLLKNDAKTLPLAKTFEHSGKMVAVVGRNAEATTNMQGNYFGTAPFLISPCAGINATLKGFTWCDKADDKGAATIALINAGKIGAVVLVVGLTSEGAAGSHDEAEGHDRSSLLLPNDQDAAISAIATAAAAKKVQVVVVSMGGGPVDLSACKANSAIGAIMWCGYPGQSGGAAIADALFGATNPSGKLTMTWYPEGFTTKVAITDMGMRPNKTSGNPGRSHRFYTGTPVFAFGEGMSYTAFDVSAPRVQWSVTSAAVIAATEGRARITRAHSQRIGTVTLDITNTGDVAGAHSAILFAGSNTISDEEREISGAPLHSVIDFERVFLQPGESTSVTIAVTAHQLTWADRFGYRVTKGGEWSFWTGSALDRAHPTRSALITV